MYMSVYGRLLSFRFLVYLISSFSMFHTAVVLVTLALLVAAVEEGDPFVEVVLEPEDDEDEYF